MTIFVTKHGIIIGVVGSYFYKKIMTENGLFVLGRPDTRVHDILWAVHGGKTVVEARVRNISGSSPLRWVVGAERCTEGLHVSLVPVRAWV